MRFLITLKIFAKRLFLLQVSIEKRRSKEQVGGGFMRTKVNTGVIFEKGTRKNKV